MTHDALPGQGNLYSLDMDYRCAGGHRCIVVVWHMLRPQEARNHISAIDVQCTAMVSMFCKHMQLCAQFDEGAFLCAHGVVPRDAMLHTETKISTLYFTRR